MGFAQRLPTHFYIETQDRIREDLAGEDLDAAIFDDPDDVAYLTGFFHFPNERPAAVWLPAAGVDEPVQLLIPQLEHDHAEYQHASAELVCYPEYPGRLPPFSVLANAIGPTPRRLGYSGAITAARLEAVATAFDSAELVRTHAVDLARMVKAPEEIGLHREAARITDLMLSAGRALVEEALRVGGTLPSEAELAGHVTQAGVAAMYAEHDEVVVVPHLAGGLVYGGPNSALPHALPSGYRLRPGEPFMLSLGAGVGGRHVEGERTFILGQPTQEQERYYTTVLAAQRIGLAGLRAGRRCSEVNAECLEVIRDAGLGNLLRHRQGHGIGVNIHEPPWLEEGDQTVLETNMIVSDEPGLYVLRHGGYRISDSVLVGDKRGDPLTSYPSDLDAIVIAV